MAAEDAKRDNPLAGKAAILGEFCKLYEPLRNNPDNIPMAKFRDHWCPVWVPLLWPQIRNFPIKPEDVIIASFPKSGTNWLHYIVHLIQTEDFGEVSPDHQQWLLEIPKPPFPSALEAKGAAPGPKILTTHLPTTLLPKEAFNGRVIYIYRNAKDTAVSFYHHYRAQSSFKYWPFNAEFDEFGRRFIKGDVLFGPYPEHVKSFVNLQKEGKDILVLCYEDVKKEPKAVIRKIADFLGKKLDDATIDKIQEASSFNKMQSNDTLNWGDAKQAGVWDPKANFIRKGQVGDWRNHFKDAQLLADFEKFITDKMPAELIPPCE